MPKSKAHKYWNKFRGWAQRLGAIRSEEPQAMEEFFVNPARIPPESLHEVMGLFSDWFLFDRKLTHYRMTPLELFIQTQERSKKFKERELSLYREFQRTNRFGIFRVEDVSPGEWMDLKAMPDGETSRVWEEIGSQNARRGIYLLARIVFFEGHWAMSGAVARMPDESRYLLDRAFSREGKELPSGGMTPRDALSMFMPKVDWEKEGIGRVRARLSSILQKSGLDITVAQIEESIRAAHVKKETEVPLIKEVQGRLPHNSDFVEASELMAVLWNLSISECDPSLDPRVLQKGPIERMLLHDVGRLIQKRFLKEGTADPESARPAIRAAFQEWLEAPQKELEGKTPRQAILAERKSMGNPQEQVGYDIRISSFDASANEKEAHKLLAAGKAAILEGNGEDALRSYEEAYKLLKGYPEVYRILGNLATAHVMLGHREHALEMLKAALKVNPDYRVARDNLGLLESMGPEEFERKRREGFFGKINVVEDTEG